MLTITGAGGSGATHLAVRLLQRLALEQGRNVATVALDDIADPSVVEERAAAALVETEVDVLLLDGLTHAAASVAPVLDRLLARHPRLSIVVTSRVALHLRIEHVVVVEPLAVPVRGADSSTLRSSDAVACFCEAAAAAGHVPTDRELPLVAEICRRLDGSPLAIVLAARRAAQLTLDDLLRQLDVRAGLDVLRGGPIDGPERHRDLAASVRWSLALLTDRQRRILGALAELNDPATLDELVAVTVETVPGSRGELLDDVDALGQLHLLAAEVIEGVPLRVVPPVVRVVVTEDASVDLHAAAIAALDRSLVPFATQHVAGARAHGDAAWLRGLSRRHRDLVAALERALDRNDLTAAVTLATASARTWHESGRASVGLPILRRLLDALRSADEDPASCATVAAWVLLFEVLTCADPIARSELGTRFDPLVDAACALGDAVVLTDVVERSVSAVRYSHHFDRLVPHLERALEACDRAGLPRHAASCTVWLAMGANVQQRFDDAARLAFAAMSRARAIGSDALMSYAAMVLAHLPRKAVAAHGPPVTMEQAVELARRSGNARLLANILPAVAAVRAAFGDLLAASTVAEEGFELALATGLYDGMLGSLLVIVEIAATRQDDEVAAIITGGLADQSALIEGPLSAVLLRWHEGLVDGVRSRLGHDRFQQVAAVGAAMRWDELTDHALAAVRRWTAPAPAPATAAAPASVPLTPRELEVLRALVTGASNKEIAADLGITRKTAMHHTSNIYRKLGVRRRAEAITWAHRHGILDAGTT